eukprot:scaffold279292_cov35-Tisochrysis_lutea.AAC.3
MEANNKQLRLSYKAYPTFTFTLAFHFLVVIGGFSPLALLPLFCISMLSIQSNHHCFSAGLDLAWSHRGNESTSSAALVHIRIIASC